MAMSEHLQEVGIMCNTLRHPDNVAFLFGMCIWYSLVNMVWEYSIYQKENNNQFPISQRFTCITDFKLVNRSHR